MILLMEIYFLYILSSRHHRYLSIGVTSDLKHGISRHRRLVTRKLKRRRVLQKLVYVECIKNVEEAVERKLRLNRFNRRQLCQLIESVNPSWDSISLSQLVKEGFDRSYSAAK